MGLDEELARHITECTAALEERAEANGWDSVEADGARITVILRDTSKARIVGVRSKEGRWEFTEADKPRKRKVYAVVEIRIMTAGNWPNLKPKVRVDSAYVWGFKRKSFPLNKEDTFNWDTVAHRINEAIAAQIGKGKSAH